jgi:hypothetical protein
VALSSVELTLDVYGGSGQSITQGTAFFSPTSSLTDTTDHEFIWQTPIPVALEPPEGAAEDWLPTVSLYSTDSTNLSPAGWAWTVTFDAPGAPEPFSFFLPYSAGGSQYLSEQAPYYTSPVLYGYIPLPPGTPSAGQVPTATGVGSETVWGATGSTGLPLPAGTAQAGYVPVATGAGSASEWFPGAGLAPLGGSGDDTANIQGLLNLGGMAALQALSFNFSAPLTVPTGGGITCPIVAQSFGDPGANYGIGGLALQGCILKASSSFADANSSTGCIVMTSPNGVQGGGQRLEGISLDLSNTPNGNNLHGVLVQNNTACVTLRDVTVYGGNAQLGGDCLHAVASLYQPPDLLNMAFCHFVGGTGGVTMSGVADTYVTACESTGNKNYAWNIINGNNTRFLGCKGETSNAGPGWLFTADSGFTGVVHLALCTSQSNYGDGFKFTGLGTGTYQLIACSDDGSGVNGGSGGGSYSGLNVTSFSGTVEATGWNTRVSSATTSPEYGVSMTSSNTLILTNANLAGATSLIHNGGGNISLQTPYSGPGLAPSGDITGATDTAALQAVLTAAPEGSTVYLQGGIFYTNAPIIHPPWVTVIGNGVVLNNSYLSDNPTTIKPVAAWAQGSAAVAAVWLSVDQTTGGYAAASAGQQLIGVNIDGSAAPSSVDGFDVYGNVGGVQMAYCSAQSVTGGGFNFLSRSGNIPDGLRLIGLMSARATGNNFFFQAADVVGHDLHAIGSNAGDGFRIITCANSHFSDCRSGNNAGHGWNFGNGTGSAAPTGYISLQNCNSQLNTEDGWYVDWTSANGGHVLNMSGCTSIGDGNNGGAGGGSFGALTIVQSTAPILMDNFVVISNTGTGNCPQYAVKATNCAYLLIRSGMLQAYSTVFYNGGSNGTILIDPGVLTGTGSPTAPSWNPLPATLSPEALPSDHGFLAWNLDPMKASGTGLMVSETQYVLGVFIRSPMLVTHVTMESTAGAAATGFVGAGLGLCSSAGTLLSGSGTSASVWQTTGTMEFTLTTPQLITPGFYWVIFFVESTGTMPTLKQSGAGNAANLGLSASSYRSCVNGTAVTTLASITPSANSQLNQFPFLIALS